MLRYREREGEERRHGFTLFFFFSVKEGLSSTRGERK